MRIFIIKIKGRRKGRKVMLFKECDTCRAKKGSPILCGGCIDNRANMMRLEKELDLFKDIVKKLVQP
jgi:hypothetical protein